MMFHLPSFLLGLAALPALLLGVLAALRLLESLAAARRHSSASSHSGASLDPLRFTPRLISQMRRPLEAEEDHARAS